MKRKTTRCLHKNVVESKQIRYHFPHGWKKDAEEEVPDLDDYRKETLRREFWCEDCGEVLWELLD